MGNAKSCSNPGCMTDPRGELPEAVFPGENLKLADVTPVLNQNIRIYEEGFITPPHDRTLRIEDQVEFLSYNEVPHSLPLPLPPIANPQRGRSRSQTRQNPINNQNPVHIPGPKNPRGPILRGSPLLPKKALPPAHPAHQRPTLREQPRIRARPGRRHNYFHLRISKPNPR